MPVYVNYKGRTGNKLFQYIAARIFSENNGLNLITKFPDTEILDVEEHKYFYDDIREDGYIQINSSSFSNDKIIFSGKNKKYVFDDYFHDGNFFSNNIEMIKKFFILPKVEINTKDIVLHLRLFDYLHFTDLYIPTSWDGSEIIHPNYYIKILEKENYDKVYIVVDEIRCEWEKKYLEYFDKFNPIIISSNPKNDFEFLMSFEKIINSNSTFSYWASFLGNSKTIYCFEKTGFYGKEIKKVGEHVKNLTNIKHASILVDEKFYFGE
jgi:hypothetical protein